MNWAEINEAYKFFLEFHQYLIKNSIFLSDELKSKFYDIDTLMWKLWVANKVGEEHGDSTMKLKGFEECDEPIERLMKEIEVLVRARLYPQDATAP